MALPLAREISRSDEKPPIRTAILPNDWGDCMDGAFLLLDWGCCWVGLVLLFRLPWGFGILATSRRRSIMGFQAAFGGF